MDRGPWWATVHRVTKSWTRLQWLSTHTSLILKEIRKLKSSFFTCQIKPSEVNQLNKVTCLALMSQVAFKASYQVGSETIFPPCKPFPFFPLPFLPFFLSGSPSSLTGSCLREWWEHLTLSLTATCAITGKYRTFREQASKRDPAGCRVESLGRKC